MYGFAILKKVCVPTSGLITLEDVELQLIFSKAGIFKQSMGRAIVPARQATNAGGIVSSESIPGLLKRLQIRALINLAEMIGRGGRGREFRGGEV
jgi:hypothetical protein